MGVSTGGGIRPGVLDSILAVYEATVAHLRHGAEEARQARGQLHPSLSWIADCMEELKTRKNSDCHFGQHVEYNANAADKHAAATVEVLEWKHISTDLFCHPL